MAVPIPLEELPVFNIDSSIDKEYDWKSGAIFLMDKPTGWSSFKLVRLLRRVLNVKKIGHAGTLDPMATGLVILCVGKATKSISQIQELDKTYLAEITFGASTPTYDAEAEPDEFASWEHISEDKLIAAIESHFQGSIMQKAPSYSALKHKGKPLYSYARAGEEVVEKIREVQIHDFLVNKIELPVIEAKIRCGKGTYIRSIAHDLGLILSSRAHLSALRRSATGSFLVDKAFSPDTLEATFTETV